MRPIIDLRSESAIRYSPPPPMAPTGGRPMAPLHRSRFARNVCHPGGWETNRRRFARWRVARMRSLISCPPSESKPLMERKELSAIVLELLEKETGETYPAVEESTTLREGLNLDSLDMAGLVLHIESHFGIQVETELLDGVKSVGDLLDVLQMKISAKPAVRRAA
ncbi:MAG: acyl carrier protein [Planctomycetota bacterium]|nr:MAG: acyl carrier protein [Planctomycetota bacterium]